MSYFIIFLAGMGFAALVDFAYAGFLRYRVRNTVPVIEDSLMLAVDPDKVGSDQMARIRDQLGV